MNFRDQAPHCPLESTSTTPGHLRSGTRPVHFFCALGIASFISGLIPSFVLGEEALREWKSASGTTLVARMLGFKEDTLTLQTAENREIQVRIDQISAEDREYLGSWLRDNGSNWRSVPAFDKGLSEDVKWQRDFDGKKSELNMGVVRVEAEGDALSGGVRVSAGSLVKVRPTEDKPLSMRRRATLKEPLSVEVEQTSGGFELEILIVFEEAKGRTRLRSQHPVVNGLNKIEKLVEDGSDFSFPASGPAEVYLYAVRRDKCVSNIVKLDARIE